MKNLGCILSIITMILAAWWVEAQVNTGADPVTYPQFTDLLYRAPIPGGALAAPAVRLAVFRDHDQVVQFFDEDPGRAVTILEANLSQEVLDKLYDLFIPPATKAEQEAVVNECLAKLRRVGLRTSEDIMNTLLSPTRAGVAGAMEK